LRIEPSAAALALCYRRIEIAEPQIPPIRKIAQMERTRWDRWETFGRVERGVGRPSRSLVRKVLPSAYQLLRFLHREDDRDPHRLFRCGDPIQDLTQAILP